MKTNNIYSTGSVIAPMTPGKKLLIVCCALLLFTHGFARAQSSLSAFAGVGLGYDAFLRDKSVTRYRNSWPLELGIQSAIGLRYHTSQAFDVLLDITLGVTNLNFPAAQKTSIYMEQIQSLMMVGSGVHIPIDDKGSSLMPYIQIGAGFFDSWGYNQTSAQQITGSFTTDNNNNRWVPLCGGGIDWQFKLFVPASFNLRFVYTPLNIFPEPVPYAIDNNTGTEELKLQGKLLQSIFTFRVYLPVRKWEPRDY